MKHLTGYDIQDTIHETLQTIVARATRRSDHKDVVIKTLKGSPPPPDEVVRLTREYDIAKKIASPGIIEVYTLERYGTGQVAIIMELFAESVDRFLKKETLVSLDRFFVIAPQLAEILGRLHNNHVIHKDINPKNILLDPQSNELKLIDFGIASELPRERQSVNVSERLEGSLPYISPEQTGRIHRGVDYRTDYYSLGATFFEMLTGHIPFQADDMMGWVSCHISKAPPPPSDLNPEIPAAIEAIVLKLMAKNAEDRYQSAYGLVKDLEVCRNAWEEHGNIEHFRPGQWDISERFQIPQKLYGREKEIDILMTTFESIAEGETELLLVSGYSGVGKSALVHEVHKPIVGKRGYFIEGKFDQLQRNMPFSAIARAFRHLVHQVLAEPGNFFIRPWNEHWEHLTPAFQTTVESGYQSGDLFFLAYASLLTYAWNPTIPLAEKITHLAHSIRICQSTGFEVAIDASALTHQTYLNYQGGTHGRFSLNTERFDEDECLERMRQRHDISGMTYYHVFKSEIFFLYEDYRETLTHITATEQSASAIKGTPPEARMCAITFFTCAALYRDAPPGEKSALKKRLKNMRKQMNAWAGHCPVNFLHLRLAMDAELAALAGQPLRAAALYDEAASKANEGGWQQDEGMILMLACKFYAGRGLKREASAYLREASMVYRTWGAHGKLAFLKETYTDLLPEQDAHVPASNTTVTATTMLSLDLETVFKAAQTLSEEVALEHLLQKLMYIVCENAGAETGYLLLPSAAGWHLAVAYIAERADVLSEPVPLTERAPVSQSIVNYVMRTHTRVVLHDASQTAQFLEDAHIRARRATSVCCLPLLHQGKLTAILYLENNLIPGAFTPERVEVLTLLGSQAAISLENAALYANLEEKVRERTAELSEANRSLQDEIQERQRAEMMAQHAKDEAERANQAKSRFLANMSHELRTPLNGILGYAQILKRRRDANKTQREGLEVIYSSGQHLLTLINDVLDLAKIESGKLELYPEPVNLPAFLDGVVGVMRMAAHQKDIRFVYDADTHLPAGIECDQKRLRQVLLNLLGNAVKFTAQGSVTLVVKTVQPNPSPALPEGEGVSPLLRRESQIHHRHHRQTCSEGEGVSPLLRRGAGGEVSLRFEIIDTGVGMTAEQMQTIFAPFEQVGETKKRQEGTGLGLAITRQLVTLMGGEIQVESALGHGSTFWFEIPVPVSLHDTRSMSRPTTTQRIMGYKGKPRIILVVDDQAENRMVLLNLLAPLGFQVLLAEDGQQGIEQANAHHPDLILTDLVMPVMTGFEMVKRIRDTGALHDAPIIAISASTYDTDKESSLDIGCQAFLPKPIDAEKLFALIAEHVGLTWIYDTSEELPQKSEAVPPAESDIIPPLQKDLEALYELTMFGNLERVREKADAIARQDAQYQAFTQIIRNHAEKLEDEPILALLEELMEQG